MEKVLSLSCSHGLSPLCEPVTLFIPPTLTTFGLGPTFMSSFKLSDFKAKFLSLVTLRFRNWIQEFGGGYCPVLSTWESKCQSIFAF